MREPETTRRAALRLGGCAVVGTLAGCSLSAGDRERTVSLGDIVLFHHPREPHTVRLELERHGRTVREVTLADLGPTHTEVVEATWSSEPAVYHLYTAVAGPLATADGVLDVFVDRFPSETHPAPDGECAVVYVHVGSPPDPGSVAIELTDSGPEGVGNCDEPDRDDRQRESAESRQPR